MKAKFCHTCSKFLNVYDFIHLKSNHDVELFNDINYTDYTALIDLQLTKNNHLEIHNTRCDCCNLLNKCINWNSHNYEDVIISICKNCLFALTTLSRTIE